MMERDNLIKVQLKEYEVEFESYLMAHHSMEFSGTKNVMIDAFPEWLKALSPDEFVALTAKFVLKKINMLKIQISTMLKLL